MLNLKVFRPLDFILLTAILAASAVCIKKSANNAGETVRVVANGSSYQYSLNQNGTYSVEGKLGTTTFRIQDRKVRIIDSPCPGKNCVNQGWHSPLVCLPNSVIITIENYGEFDAVSE